MHPDLWLGDWGEAGGAVTSLTGEEGALKRETNLLSKAVGFRSRMTRRASSMASLCMGVLWQAWHLHLGPQVVDDEKHWQYNLRHLDFLHVHPPPTEGYEGVVSDLSTS